MVEIHFSSKAADDLSEIITGLFNKAGLQVATQYSQKFDALFQRLQDYPQQCPGRSKLGPVVRVCVVYPYLVIYDYLENDKKIIILRCLHGRQRVLKSSL